MTSRGLYGSLHSVTNMSALPYAPPQLDKARSAFHKVQRKEQTARDREVHAKGNPDVAIEKQRKIQEERELAQQETEKVSDRQ